MASKRISELAAATSVAPTDILAITQGFSGVDTGTTRLVSVATLGSGLPVTATGSTTARTPAARFAEVHDVLDFGANPAATTSAQDSFAAFVAAQQAAQYGSLGTVRIPAGTYWLSSIVYSVDGVVFQIDPGVSLIGPGNILGLNDQIIGQFGPIYTKFTSSNSGAFGVYGSMFVGASTGSTGYEKAAGYFRIKTSDIAGAGNANDSVALQTRAETTGGVASSRIWGSNLIADVTPGTDAFAIGSEIAVQNDGTSTQPLMDQPNSKIGVNIITGGTTNCTAAICVNTSGSSFWETGVFIKNTSINTNAISVNAYSGGGWVPVSWISKAGDGVFLTLKSSGGLSAFGVTPPATRPAITGSRSGATVAVLAALLTALAATGVITDSTTA